MSNKAIKPLTLSLSGWALVALGCCIALLLAPLTAFAQSPARRIVLSGVASPVTGEHRFALVIGNTHYGGANELTNPENDAKAVARTLQSLGFTVTLVLDATRENIRDSVHDFSGAVSQSGSGTVALFYYSGHGMQVDGKNYLIPIGFEGLKNKQDVDDYAYSAQKALDEMQSAGARVNIVILDACRNNPFEGTRAWGGRGLGRLEAQGVYISYATAEGKTASDNPGESNGLFTQELLKNLKTPGLNIHQVFQNTRASVYDRSNHDQYPFDYDGLLNDNFYFVPVANATTPIITDIATTATLTVSCATPGAKVLVDGRSATAGSTVTLDLGEAKSKTVEVDVSAAGYETRAKQVTLSRGGNATLDFSLDRLPQPQQPNESPEPYPTAVDGNPVVALAVAHNGEPLGKILIELFPKQAPISTANYLRLVSNKFYNGLTFHRITNLDPQHETCKIVQGGDPRGDGSGGPGWTIKGEFTSNGVDNPLRHTKGAVAMARTNEPNSAGSQFYICIDPVPFLDGNYAVFGQVIKGLDIADRLQVGDTIVSATIAK
ncbi:MAG: peptidylprolyl isomerase [Capsulimonadaceae bacterium]|nr:peptidylprolyl isomerase [Capsulimonadaceae bacterium]